MSNTNKRKVLRCNKVFFHQRYSVFQATQQQTLTLGGSQAAQNMAAEWSEQRPVGLGGKVRQRVSAPVTAPQDTEAFHWDSGRRFLFQFLGKVDYWTLENLQRLNKKYLLLAI